MFNIPEYYKMDVKLALKDFIPKDLKPEDKKQVEFIGSKPSLTLFFNMVTTLHSTDKQTH